MLVLPMILACLSGTPVRLDVTRDTWFSSVGAEEDGNNGGAPRLKLKSHQEMSLVDFDVAPLRGRIVKAATLHVRSTGEPRLLRVTTGGFTSDWFEGTGTNYEKQNGSSTFRRRKHPDEPWKAGSADLCSVMFGEGGHLWGMADASSPDAQGFQTISVDPRVVAARIAGISQGFLLFDDTGTEWARSGEKWDRRLFPNRFLYSREQNRASAPFLTVELGDEDRQSPEAPKAVQSSAEGMLSGTAEVSWETPPDRGGSGTIGFRVEVDGRPIAASEVAPASRVGERIGLTIAGIPGSGTAEVTIRAVDGAGNAGEAVRIVAKLSKIVPPPLPGRPPAVPKTSAPLPRLGSAEMAVMDELDKLSPDSGATIPARPASYLASNHVWDATSKEIRLFAARNEFSAFQVVVKGPVAGLNPALEFDDPNIRGRISSFANVGSKKGPMPDPVVPTDWPADVPEKGRKSASLHAEVYVPHELKPGLHRGTLKLRSRDGASLELPVSLTVWDFTLPDSLSFLPEMNAYGLPENERDYYRLAHEHRTVLNRLGYSHNGKVHEGFAPRKVGKTLDWTEWDRRFGPLFDGSAFADLPRKGVPIECFYLPLFENWPAAIESHYNGSYWADQAFKPGYREEFTDVARQMAKHFHDKDWGGTFFQCYFNGKNDFKANGWSRSTSPWLLDEPASFQDFWALRYFGQAFHDGVNAAGGGPAKVVFRCDISRPQWQRDSLDGLLDYNVVGGAFHSYRRMVLERKRRTGQVVVEYGSSNPIEESNVQPAAWCLDIWTLGADGVLPWQTIGSAESWDQADELSLFYPSKSGGPPVPSVRLKSYRRGQQDVEYLTLWARVSGLPREAIAETVRLALGLAGERKGTEGFLGGEDAGRMAYDRLSPEALWDVRVRVGAAISATHPKPERRVVELRTPTRPSGPK